MLKPNVIYFTFLCILALLLSFGCEPAPEPESTGETVDIEVISPESEYSGFLENYSQLQPDPENEDAYTYVNEEDMKDIHQYVCMIVDPVKIYLASGADRSQLPEKGSGTVARYFRHALMEAVSGAFTVVDDPGPATLRLRSALAGVDVSEATEGGTLPEGVEELERPINIGEVWVEAELVDSVTGDRIAAAVDKAKLGEGVVLSSSKISQVEVEGDVEEALEGWASRLRAFLDEWHELKGEDAERTDKSYRPY
jgi:hypothetical protein